MFGLAIYLSQAGLFVKCTYITVANHLLSYFSFNVDQ